MIILGYVDPGMGLLAWQALVAACLGLLFYLKKTRSWLVGFSRKLLRIEKPKQEPPDKLDSPVDSARR